MTTRIERMARRAERTAADWRAVGNEHAAQDAQDRADRLRSRAGGASAPERTPLSLTS